VQGPSGLAADGQLESAVAAEEKAVRLARQTSDRNLAEFEKRLRKHQGSLAAARKAALPPRRP
jgi:vacuolar-type H+-ATPase subunit H